MLQGRTVKARDMMRYFLISLFVTRADFVCSNA